MAGFPENDGKSKFGISYARGQRFSGSSPETLRGYSVHSSFVSNQPRKARSPRLVQCLRHTGHHKWCLPADFSHASGGSSTRTQKRNRKKNRRSMQEWFWWCLFVALLILKLKNNFVLIKKCECSCNPLIFRDHKWLCELKIGKRRCYFI